MDVIKELTADMLKKDAPEILIGSTVKVHVRIKEGEKERIQVFEGTVIAKNNSGIAETLLPRLSLFARVRSAERSFIICVTESVRLLRLKSLSVNQKKKEGGRFILSPFLLLKNTGNQEKGGALWKKKKKLKPTRI